MMHLGKPALALTAWLTYAGSGVGHAAAVSFGEANISAVGDIVASSGPTGNPSNFNEIFPTSVVNASDIASTPLLAGFNNSVATAMVGASATASLDFTGSFAFSSPSQGTASLSAFSDTQALAAGTGIFAAGNTAIVMISADYLFNTSQYSVIKVDYTGNADPYFLNIGYYPTYDVTHDRFGNGGFSALLAPGSYDLGGFLPKFYNTSYSADGVPASDQETARSSFGFSIGAVPEPSTWALMLIGFGATGIALRGRRGKDLRIVYA